MICKMSDPKNNAASSQKETICNHANIKHDSKEKQSEYLVMVEFQGPISPPVFLGFSDFPNKTLVFSWDLRISKRES